MHLHKPSPQAGAKHTAMDLISRIVLQNTQAHNYLLKKGKLAKNLMEKFKIHSLVYINISNAGFHSSRSQIFVMNVIIISRSGGRQFENNISSMIQGTN